MKLEYDASSCLFRDVGMVLKKRYPWLSEEEHYDRQQAALHEASHLITSMVLSTGWVGWRVFIRVPGVSPGMHALRGVSGSVHCGAEAWENAIVDFAGCVAALVSDDPQKLHVARHDAVCGMETVHELVREAGSQTIYDVRWELLTEALRIVVTYWPVIDLVATSILLNARKGGGMSKKRFQVLQSMARAAITEAVSLPTGHPRKVMFPVPDAFCKLIKRRKKLPSRILQLPKKWYSDYGYPYE